MTQNKPHLLYLPLKTTHQDSIKWIPLFRAPNSHYGKLQPLISSHCFTFSVGCLSRKQSPLHCHTLVPVSLIWCSSREKTNFQQRCSDKDTEKQTRQKLWSKESLWPWPVNERVTSVLQRIYDWNAKRLYIIKVLSSENNKHQLMHQKCI
jgi:hypothetical protein